MRFILYNASTQKSCEAQFPASGKEIQDFCDKMEIPNTAYAEATVTAVNMLNCELEEGIFQDKTFVLDELNFLAKQLEQLTQKEQGIFSLTASEFQYSMREMIQLTVNTHNVLVVENQPDLVAVAERLFLEQNIKLTQEEVCFSQEEASRFLTDYAMGQGSKLLENGMLFYQTEVFEEFYTGNCFPDGCYDDSEIVVDLYGRNLKQGDHCETLTLPFHESELSKSLERLGVKGENLLSQVEVKLFHCDVHEN